MCNTDFRNFKMHVGIAKKLQGGNWVSSLKFSVVTVQELCQLVTTR